MQVFSLEIDISRSGFEGADLEDRFWALLSSLYDTRQIISNEHCVVRSGDRVSVQVTVPEPDALMHQTTAYVHKAWNDVERLTGSKVALVPQGQRVEYYHFDVSARSSFYILRWGWYSPLICGDTHMPIPLYRIPPTNPDALCYDNLRSWENAYKRLYGLWLGSGVGERFAQRQMQELNSKLSEEGRRLCRQIEVLTGVPTYYFLFNYRAWSQKSDRARLCPATSRPWLIEGATEASYIAFKSDEARLVSQLSSNCST